MIQEKLSAVCLACGIHSGRPNIAIQASGRWMFVFPITGLRILDFSGSSVSTASHHSNNQNNLVWSSYFGELAFTSKPTEILYYRYLQDSSSKELSFLLSLSLKRFSQNDRSPGSASHSSDSSLFSLPSPQPGQQGWRGETSWRAGPQPPHRRWGTQCWHWPEPRQTSLARKAPRVHAALMRALTLPSGTVTSSASPSRAGWGEQMPVSSVARGLAADGGGRAPCYSRMDPAP